MFIFFRGCSLICEPNCSFLYPFIPELDLDEDINPHQLVHDDDDYDIDVQASAEGVGASAYCREPSIFRTKWVLLISRKKNFPPNNCTKRLVSMRVAKLLAQYELGDYTIYPNAFSDFVAAWGLEFVSLSFHLLNSHNKYPADWARDEPYVNINSLSRGLNRFHG